MKRYLNVGKSQTILVLDFADFSTLVPPQLASVASACWLYWQQRGQDTYFGLDDRFADEGVYVSFQLPVAPDPEFALDENTAPFVLKHGLLTIARTVGPNTREADVELLGDMIEFYLTNVYLVDLMSRVRDGLSSELPELIGMGL